MDNMVTMKVMGITLGVLFGAVALYFIYNVFIRDALLKGKSIAGKAESLLKKDMSSKYARCTFYMNNDYDNGYSQSEWLKLFKESVTDKELAENSQEYNEAVAPFINAIVVDEGNYYVRRGMEKMGFDPFSPGHNDRISLNYFIEPYKYVKNEVRTAKRSESPQRSHSEDKHAAFRRCNNCVHERSCDITVKMQTGTCGGYTPKERKGFLR